VQKTVYKVKLLFTCNLCLPVEASKSSSLLLLEPRISHVAYGLSFRVHQQSYKRLPTGACSHFSPYSQ